MPFKCGKDNPAYGKPMSRALVDYIKTRRGIPRSREVREKISNSHMGITPSEETRLKMRNRRLGNPLTKNTKDKIGESLKKNTSHIEHCRQIGYSKKGIPRTEDVIFKIIEKKIGGIWYGNVRYYKESYCERWTPDFRNRIRGYWGNVSVYSGKNKGDNGGMELACHHVYYQKKACCDWDEDYGGYYAIIDGEKYYIKGDPNKFVTLTQGENTMVNYNKLDWVRFFEDLIEAQGGKCYYTKEEMEELNGDLKMKQTTKSSRLAGVV